jgi:flagellar motor protein MotB
MVVLMTWRQSYNDDQEKHLSSNQMSNLQRGFDEYKAQSSVNVSNLQTEIARLIYDFSTNSTILPAVRLAILDDQREKIAAQISEAQEQGIPISVSLPDISTIRANREKRRHLQELQEREKEIQRAKDAIKQQEEQAKAQVVQQQEEQMAKAESAKKESEETKIYLDVFDYTLNRLYKMLDNFSKVSGENIHLDFPTEFPSAYNSRFVSQGHLVIGKHTMGIGTNTAWNFEISTVNQPQHILYDLGWMNFKQPLRPQTLSFAFEISSGVQKVLRRLDNRIIAGQFLVIIPYDDSVFVTFGTPRSQVISDMSNMTDYKTKIDAAITTLMDSVDERWPLPSTNNLHID